MTMKYKTLIITMLMMISLTTSAFGLSCGDVLTVDETLVEDLIDCDSSYGVIINATDVTLDCAGYTISSNLYATANNWAGVRFMSLSDNFEMINCEILNFEFGVYASSTGGGINDPDLSRNPTNVIISNNVFNNQTKNVDLSSSSGFAYDNLLYSNNVHIYHEYALTLRSNNSLFLNNSFSCDDSILGCDSTAYMTNFINSVVDGWYVTGDATVCIYLGDAPRDVTGTLNDLQCNTTDLASWGDPYGVYCENCVDVTIDNSTLNSYGSTTNFYPIYVDSGSTQIDVIDTTYSKNGNDVTDGFEQVDSGNLDRYFRVDVSTNVEGVDINATSILAVSTLGTTDSGGNLVLLLHQYDIDNVDSLTTSLPYNTTAIKDDEEFSDTLNVGQGQSNSITFGGFTLAQILGLASVILTFVLLGTFFFVGKETGLIKK